MPARPAPITHDDPRLAAFTMDAATTEATLAQIAEVRQSYAQRRALRAAPQPFTVHAEDGTPIILPRDRRRPDADTANLLCRAYGRRRTDRFAAEPVQHSAFAGL